MRKRLIKKLIAFHNLQSVLHEIFEGNNWEYQCYKEEIPYGSPIQYIEEILIVGRNQLKDNKQIKVIKRYYQCDTDTAILLHKLTDAYVLIYWPLQNAKIYG